MRRGESLDADIWGSIMDAADWQMLGCLRPLPTGRPQRKKKAKMKGKKRPLSWVSAY